MTLRSRRNFLKSVTTFIAGSAAIDATMGAQIVPLLADHRKAVGPKAESMPFVGIQMSPHTMLDYIIYRLTIV